MAMRPEGTALTPPSTPPTPAVHGSNSLDDIFSTSRSPSPTRPSMQHPTEIPRLRATHNTAGYRAGVSVSKDPAVQPGFDEGYPLGATFGLRVGCLLGVLEGLVAACGAGVDGMSHSKRLRLLLLQAKQELRLEKIFAEDVWKSDGTWGYSVPREQRGEITWREVVESHPVGQKWEDIVQEEVRRAGVNVGRFEGPDWEAGRIGDDSQG